MVHVSTFIDRRPGGFTRLEDAVGTLANNRLPTHITGHGTMQARVGSFGRLIGTLSSTNLYGTIPASLIPADYEGGVHLNFRPGTLDAGSITPNIGRTTIVTVDHQGRYWMADQFPSDTLDQQYVYMMGTLGLRAGSMGRMGTQMRGSFRTASASTTIKRAAAFSPRGDLWLSEDGDRIYRYGTLGLRNGTNSRFGTILIGSATMAPVNNPPGGFTGMAIDAQSRVWAAWSNDDHIGVWSTGALVGGTPSRFSVTLQGSARAPGTFSGVHSVAGIALSRRGRLWGINTVSAGPDSAYLFEMGTNVPPGNASLFNLRIIGSLRLPGLSHRNAAFDRNGYLLVVDGRAAPSNIVSRYGTTPGTFQVASLFIDNFQSNIGSFNQFIGTLGATRITHGSLALARLPRQLTGRGTVTGAYGSYGTTGGALLRARFGSFTGTLRAPLLRGGMGSHGTGAIQSLRGRYGSFAGTLRAPLLRGPNGSFGTTRGHIGSFGTLLHGLLRGGYGSQGTSRARMVRGVYGSFTGTLRAPLLRNASGSTGTGAVQFLRGRYGSFTGTLRAPLLRGANGSFGTTRGHIGSFGTLVHGLLRGGYGSHGTSRARVVRGVYGSFTGTVQVPLVRGAMGSTGTGAVQFLRGRFGSFAGTLRASLLRGAVGSFSRVSAGSITPRVGSFTGTLISPRVRGQNGSFAGTLRARVGSFAGTLRAGILRGLTGSFNRFAGTLTGSRITYGSLRRGRFMQSLGTHLVGSIAGNTLVTRYAVWPTAFPAGTYFPMMSVEQRSTTPLAQLLDYRSGILSRSPGSLQYYVANANAALARPPPGTIHLGAFR